MRRRDFILTAVGATVGWSSAALAQSTDRVRLVGLLNALGSDDPEGEIRVVIFQQALQQLGWETGRNLRIDFVAVPRAISKHRDSSRSWRGLGRSLQ